jgi:hypothetical protein
MDQVRPVLADVADAQYIAGVHLIFGRQVPLLHFGGRRTLVSHSRMLVPTKRLGIR